MPRKSTKKELIISENELKNLLKIQSSRTNSKATIERATMLSMYYTGQSITEIARTLNTNRPKVERQIKKALDLGAIESLKDMPRSGKPKTITPEARIWLSTIASHKPQEFGYTQKTWTTALLAQFIRENCASAGHESLSKICKGTISKLLTSNSKPHKPRSHSKKTKPQSDKRSAFVLYIHKEIKQAQTLNGLITFSIYCPENHSQTLINGTKDSTSEKDEHLPLSKKQQPAFSLLTGIDLSTSKMTVIAKTQHRRSDFVEFLKKLDETYIDKERITIVLNNHFTISSKNIKNYLDTVPNRFEFVFNPTHGLYLNIIDSFFDKLLKTLLRGIKVHSKEELAGRILFHIDLLNESPTQFLWSHNIHSIEWG